MTIIIQNTTDLPIYMQIKEQIKSAILKGEVLPNAQLPSIRTLAKDLKISVITTTRAYTELEQEGYIVIMQGKGCYVCPPNYELLRETLLVQIESHLEKALELADLAGLTVEELQQLFQLQIGGYNS